MASVSVIIAVLNRAATLQRCLDSVFTQTAAPLEVIVCDGGSTDGSREILAANGVQLAYWQSQPDRNVPHAWNMALARATSEWVCFLGADDRFARPDTVARMLAAGNNPKINFVSGQAMVVDETDRVRRIVGARWDWGRMKRYQNVAHPGALHRRELFARHGNFDESYRIACDYEFLMRAGRDIRAEFLAEPVTLMGASGQSNTQIWRVLRENRRIHTAHPEVGTTAAAFNHAIAAAKQIARTTLRRV